jgi:hypothetical protein
MIAKDENLYQSYFIVTEQYTGNVLGSAFARAES